MTDTRLRNIGFATYAEEPTLIDDDRLSLGPLLQRGVSVRPVIWDATPSIPVGELQALDALVFRSVWNYHQQGARFMEWIESLATAGVRTLNPLRTVRWNLHKRYLLDLAARGATLPHTSIVDEKAGRDRLQEALLALRERGTIVVKPAISLNGHDTWRVDLSSREGMESALRKGEDILASGRAVLLQEYVEEVTRTGEVSLIFFNGRFSHAIRKLPSAGEFRIHREYGGTRHPFAPDEAMIAEARAILDLAPREGSAPLVYARVDGVERAGKLVLIELEVIDPMLFLGYAEGAPERFAEAISASLGSG